MRSTTDLWLSQAQRQACQVASDRLASSVAGTNVSCLGTVAYDELRLAKVFSPVSGMVSQILAEPGSRVAEGSPLAVLQSADMAGAKADLDRANASLLAATEGAARQAKLFAQEAASARDVEAARDALRRAQAERTRAIQQYALLTGGKHAASEQTFTLRSPLSGEVVGRNVGIGSQVQGQYAGGTAGPLFVVADLSSVWLLADLQEGELGRVQRGATVSVRAAAPPIAAAAMLPLSPADSVVPSARAKPSVAEVTGQVDWLADVLDPDSHTLKVRCVVGNADRRLRPNMRVVLDISGSGQAALRVPVSSVLFVERQPYVFVAVGGQPARQDGAQLMRLRPVALDDDSPHAPAARPSSRETHRLVLAGLAIGDEVVVHGAACLLQRLFAPAADR